MPVGEAHEICDRVEHALWEAIGEPLINIHFGPPHKTKHSAVLVLP